MLVKTWRCKTTNHSLPPLINCVVHGVIQWREMRAFQVPKWQDSIQNDEWDQKHHVGNNSLKFDDKNIASNTFISLWFRNLAEITPYLTSIELFNRAHQNIEIPKSNWARELCKSGEFHQKILFRGHYEPSVSTIELKYCFDEQKHHEYTTNWFIDDIGLSLMHCERGTSNLASHESLFIPEVYIHDVPNGDNVEHTTSKLLIELKLPSSLLILDSHQCQRRQSIEQTITELCSRWHGHAYLCMIMLMCNN